MELNADFLKGNTQKNKNLKRYSLAIVLKDLAFCSLSNINEIFN